MLTFSIVHWFLLTTRTPLRNRHSVEWHSACARFPPKFVQSEGGLPFCGGLACESIASAWLQLLATKRIDVDLEQCADDEV